MAHTLEDVARLAGVSRSTVSRVINDHPSVEAETRRRVWEAIRESGYRPHAVARSLVTKRTHIIGMVIPEAVTALFTDPFVPILLRGATEACYERGYQLMLSLFSSKGDHQEIYQRLVGNAYLEGVIVAAAALDDPLIPDLLRDGVPFVAVGRPPDARATSVDVDNIGGAQLAVDHLIRLGHRRIGTLTGPAEMAAAEDRLIGYRQALAVHRIPVEEDLIVEGDYTESGGFVGMQRLLPAEPSAVFVASDMMAVGALKALRQAGRRVPEDTALVSFDDIPVASALDPPLTTVHQPIRQMAALAVETLVELVEHPGSGPRRIVLPTRLIIRESCSKKEVVSPGE